jgi:isoleucyl-tRNA synthetase
MLDAQSRQGWDSLLAARGVVTRAIEALRRGGVVGHSLDTRVTLYLSGSLERRIKALNTDVCAFCIVSQLRTAPLADAPAEAFSDPEVEGVAVMVEKALGGKCERCWMYSAESGADAEHPTLCPRCAAVLKNCDGAV